MKILLKSVVVCAIIAACVNLNAQTVTVDPGTLTLGYMNVFNKPQDGGAFQFGSTWGVGDLVSSFSGSTLTLGPNEINDPNSYWYTPSGGPGAIGNKTMDANLYNETTGMYVGTTLDFTGVVLQDSLLGSVNQLGNGWTAVAFIKDFAPDYSSSVSVTAPLTPGTFNISLATINDPTRHIQYGFEVIGPDVWMTDVGPYGTITVVPVPEPSTLALIGLGLLGAWRFRHGRSA
jgi:PEP-CTERM motif